MEASAAPGMVCSYVFPTALHIYIVVATSFPQQEGFLTIDPGEVKPGPGTDGIVGAARSHAS